MTPKDPFLEGTFWDKFWRPIRSRALLFTPELEITLTRRYPKLIFRINCQRNYPEMPLPNAWALTRIARNWLRELIKDYPYGALPGVTRN